MNDDSNSAGRTASTLARGLVHLTMGRAANRIAALAEPYKDRPVLYVGGPEEAIPTALREAGHMVTVCNPWDGLDFDVPRDAPFGLVVLSAFAYAVSGELQGRQLAEYMIEALAHDGSVCIDQQDWDELDRQARTGHETEVQIGGQPIEAGMVLEAHAACDRLEHALITAGLIVVNRTAVTNDDWRQRILVFKRRTQHPLCHPLAPLTLSGESDKVLTLREGKGCKVRDDKGREYIDANGGLWNTHIGLGNAEVIDAITTQLNRLAYATLFGERGNEPAGELASALLALAPYPMQWVCHTGSGSESTELGIRLALLYQMVSGRSGRKKIIHLDESYHGSFAASASVSALMPLKDMFQSNIYTAAIPTPNVLKCPTWQSHNRFALECADALEEQARNGDVAAFIIEPVLGSAGVIIPPAPYFDRIRAICDKYEILLIVDEVATGFGRTGKWFACEHFNLRPDILLLAKGINSGYLPLGAVLFSAEIGETFITSGLPLIHGSTYNGHPVCCASALANLEVLKREGLIERSAEMGVYFKRELETLTELQCVSEVRGIGLMLAVEIVQEDGSPAAPLQLYEVLGRLQEEGVLAYQSLSAISFCPALVITKDEIDTVVAALRRVLSAARLSSEQLSWAAAAGTADTPRV